MCMCCPTKLLSLPAYIMVSVSVYLLLVCRGIGHQMRKELNCAKSKKVPMVLIDFRNKYMISLLPSKMAITQISATLNNGCL